MMLPPAWWMVRLGYRWWTVCAWVERGIVPGVGVKLGPVSLGTFRADGRWWLTVCTRNRPIYDGYLRHLAVS